MLQYDVAAIGESLIDFTPSGKTPLGAELFARNPGGAPANVLAICTKLGLRTAFLGKVGDDPFGRFLRETMESAGIDCRGLILSGTEPTTLAFVQLSPTGDRTFSFYRKHCADVSLTPEELDPSVTDGCRVLHFGGVSLTDEHARSATLEAVRRAKAAGAIISYDPNYRAPLWPDAATAAEMMRAALPLADIIKVSGDELELMCGERDPAKGAELLAKDGAALVMVTLGAEGSYYRTPTCTGRTYAYDVKTVDTTGAGDTFMGSVLSLILREPSMDAISPQRWEYIMRFAGAAGSLATTAPGAIPAMPTEEEVLRCMETVRELK